MKKISALLLLIITVFSLSGCQEAGKSPAGKVYTYEKEGWVGDFTICVEKDGTFCYCEGPWSSYVGYGEWSYGNGILTLSDTVLKDNPQVFRFLVKGDDIAFIEENSDDFMYVEVADGDIFHGVKIEDYDDDFLFRSIKAKGDRIAVDGEMPNL